MHVCRHSVKFFFFFSFFSRIKCVYDRAYLAGCLVRIGGKEALARFLFLFWLSFNSMCRIIFSRKSRLHRTNKEWMKSKRRRQRRQHICVSGEEKLPNRKRVSVKSHLEQSTYKVCFIGSILSASTYLPLSVYPIPLSLSLSIHAGNASALVSRREKKKKKIKWKSGIWKLKSNEFHCHGQSIVYANGQWDCVRKRELVHASTRNKRRIPFSVFLISFSRQSVHTNRQMMVICSKWLLF